MRVLILTTIVACAFAAPSDLHAVVDPVVRAIAVPAATVDPGDVQAAAINAKVALEDQTQLAADQARERAEIELEERKEKALEIESMAKEKNEEAFWSVEEKKWQALEAVNTAAAKLDGAVANNADILSRSAFGVVVPNYIAPVPAPVISPFVAPLTYAAPLLPKFELKEQRPEDRREEMRPSEERREEMRPSEDRREEMRPSEERREEMRPSEERREEMRPNEERKEEMRPTEERRQEMRNEMRNEERKEERPEMIKTAEPQRAEERPQEAKPLEARPLAYAAPFLVAPGLNPAFLQPVVYSYLPGQVAAPVVAPTLIKQW